MADDDRPDDEFDDLDDGDTGATGRRSRPDSERDITDLGDLGENPSFFDDPEPETAARAEPEDFGFDDIERDADPAPRRSLRPGGSRSGGGAKGAKRSGTRMARPGGSGGARGRSRPRVGGTAGSSGLTLQNPMVRIGLGILAIIALVVVLALVVKDCRRSAEVDSYKRYTNDAAEIAKQSQDQGKELLGLLLNRDGKNASALKKSITDLATKADGLTDNAEGLSPPGGMSEADAGLQLALKYRATNLRVLADEIPEIISTRNKNIASGKVAARMERFLASDVVYRDSFVAPARAALGSADITGVEVTDLALFLPGVTVKYVTVDGAAAVVNTIKTGSAGGGTTTTGGTGLRGNSLVATFALPSETKLSTDQTTSISADLTEWKVTVENGGEFDETDVQVTATLSYPDKPNGDIVKEFTIPQINSGDTLDVNIPAPAPNEYDPGAEGNLRVEIKGVALERNLDNNVADYPVKIVFN